LLPHHLAERTHALNPKALEQSAAFVLCWLHHAIRDHENPALDVALTIGNAIGKPVLVYQGLGGRHRYNSDRHHTFIMEGARDLQRGIADRGIAYAFWLPTNVDEVSPLRRLMDHSCALVTEDFPAPPFPRWSVRHANRARVPTLAVDSTCVMPLRILDERFTRAFEFRDAAGDEWQQRLASTWTDVVPDVEPWDLDVDTLGFEPPDLSAMDIAETCAACDIDHSIPPVRHVRGGSTAGYRRWAEFKKTHLRRYDRRRNDAADIDAVSCLSPYLHHGHVSALRIAREAMEIGGRGAEKFLDELLVWRELAHNFCAHTPEERLESLEAIPSWARKTLSEHAQDGRDSLYSDESLARGQTTDRLWNAAQKSLLWNGELHNNLRMTWGKMIPHWTRDATHALRVLIELNHRYALDGSDPNSYGGLLWCLGQFDRPFKPERAVLGRIRGRSTADHEQRLDPTVFEAAVHERHAAVPFRVAVIGAGVSGLTCAGMLQDHGCTVTVFDRGRRPGGRLSTRRMGSIAIDHGAPFFHVSDERFRRHVDSWIEDGVCSQWSATVGRWDGVSLTEHEHTLYVGTPTMDAVCTHLGRDLAIESSVAATRMERKADGWAIEVERHDAGGTSSGPFDAVVLAMPEPQVRRLLPEHESSPAGAALVPGSGMYPTWVLMCRIAGPANRLPPIINTPRDEVIAMFVKDDAKPARHIEPDVGCWIVHASRDWSTRNIDATRDDAEELLREESARVLSAITQTAAHSDQVVPIAAHRWGFARPREPVRAECGFDADMRIAVCGDGYAHTGVEAAYLSGQAAAARLLSLRTRTSTGAEG
jgi:photolyase PhrII